MPVVHGVDNNDTDADDDSALFLKDWIGSCGLYLLCRRRPSMGRVQRQEEGEEAASVVVAVAAADEHWDLVKRTVQQGTARKELTS